MQCYLGVTAYHVSMLLLSFDDCAKDGVRKFFLPPSFVREVKELQLICLVCHTMQRIMVKISLTLSQAQSSINKPDQKKGCSVTPGIQIIQREARTLIRCNFTSQIE